MNNINKNVLTLVCSAIVSVIWFFMAPLLPIFQCDPTEFGCVGTGIAIAFIHFIIIPIIFGVLGYVLSQEHRLKQAFYSFGISLVVAILVFLPGLIIRNNENNLKREQDIKDMKANYEANPEQYKSRPY